VVILVSDIAAGAAEYETLLGRAPSWRDAGDGSDRLLFTLDNMSLELMAPSGQGVAADDIRTLIKSAGEGLASLCFSTGDIARMHRRLERLALAPDPIADVEGRDFVSGAVLRWRRTRAKTDLTRGVRMFFIELDGQRPLSPKTADTPILGLDHVVVST